MKFLSPINYEESDNYEELRSARPTGGIYFTDLDYYFYMILRFVF